MVSLDCAASLRQPGGAYVHVEGRAIDRTRACKVSRASRGVAPHVGQVILYNVCECEPVVDIKAMGARTDLQR